MGLNQAAAENIRRIRRARKLSLERAAAEAGVSRSTLGQIERGEANPSVAVLERLAAALKVPAAEFLRDDRFESLRLYPELENKPERLEGGRVLLRRSVAYEEATCLESFFLDVYIGGAYVPEPSVPGCLCAATVLSGTAQMQAEGGDYTLQERDALRFAADRPWRVDNQGSATARLLLLFQYRKKEETV